MTTSSAFEAFLARVYVDPVFRARFLADPGVEAARAGLSPLESEAVQNIDRAGLELAARSYASKRGKQRRTVWLRRLLQRWAT